MSDNKIMSAAQYHQHTMYIGHTHMYIYLQITQYNMLVDQPA